MTNDAPLVGVSLLAKALRQTGKYIRQTAFASKLAPTRRRHENKEFSYVHGKNNAATAWGFEGK
jgi:hypothetical protein